MPSETHEHICRRLRQKLAKQGFKEAKNPLPNYRFDVYARKQNSTGRIIEQVVVEAEIESTLFKEHTIDQLQSMCRFLKHEKKRGIATKGILAVPRKTSVGIQARQLLRSIRTEAQEIDLFEIPA